MRRTAPAPRTPVEPQLGGPNVVLRSGNLFDSGADAIVVTVNCVGIMGKGIALEAKNRYPELFEQYVAICNAGGMQLGRPVFFPQLLPPSVVLFPTKDHWRSFSKLSDIEAGLDYLVDHHRGWGITSIAVPPLGCGNGGLEWAVVGPALFRRLSRLSIPVYLYVPTGVSADAGELDHLQATLAAPSDIEAARRTSPPEVIAIVLALAHALRQRPGKRFGRTLMQKLGYFALAAGIRAPIRYLRRPVGPQSPEWHAHIHHLVNNGILLERRAGAREGFAYEPGPSFPDYADRIKDALEPLRPAVERVGDLLASLSADQAELAATVHMVAADLMNAQPGRPVPDEEIIRGVQDWKHPRKEPFSPERIATCVRWLRERGWLPGRAE